MIRPNAVSCRINMPAFSGLRVLVVEDEMLMAWMLHDILVDLGCEVVGPAGRVAQALALVECTVVDATVLDVNLDGERSYPVADALQARHVPFFFSTGYQGETLPAAYQACPRLLKPFPASAFVQMLKSVMAASG